MDKHWLTGATKKPGTELAATAGDTMTTDNPGRPWETSLRSLAVICLLVTLLTMTAGLPYLRTGVTNCSATTVEQPCGPPVDCNYVGLQGRRGAHFVDADICPLIVFLPWRVQPRPEIQTMQDLPPVPVQPRSWNQDAVPERNPSVALPDRAR